MIHLLTNEKDKLGFFIMQSKENQALILFKAKRDHTVSGPLLDAYRLVMENIR